MISSILIAIGMAIGILVEALLPSGGVTTQATLLSLARRKSQKTSATGTLKPIQHQSPPLRSASVELSKTKSIPPSSTKSIERGYIATTTGKTTTTAKTTSSSTRKATTKNNDAKRASSDTLISSFNRLSISKSLPSRISAAALPNAHVRYISTLSLSSISDVVRLIKEKRCENIIVMAGAGISTPSGIPDFRTPGTGLYDNLAEYNLPDPSAVFDIYYFAHNPRPFFKLTKSLYPGNHRPNYVHYFVRLLHEKGLLLKMYTQNIDALERMAGVPESKLVEAHGSFATATCRYCKATYPGHTIMKTVMEDKVPKCEKTGCHGVIKPDIVFFGEDLPPKFFNYPKDFAKCDLLIVLGTSLEVEPFASLVYEVGRSVPRTLFNRAAVGPFSSKRKRPNDVVVKGDITEGIRKIVDALDWTSDIDTLIETSKKTAGQETNPFVSDTMKKG